MDARFDVGSAVVVRASGEQGVVLRCPGNGMVDVALPGGVHLLHADDLSPARREPDQLLLDGELGDPVPYALRLQSLYLQHAYKFDPLSGLSNARIEPQFHQVFVAWRVNDKLAPRMILADEVGLGKTIEAGLIIKEMRARGFANRVLIVCPSSLQLQWQQEMKSKFNETFEVIDSAALKYLSRGGGNPWMKQDSVICSLPFASHKSRMDGIVETDWDLVVFDEAHRVRRWLQGRQPKVTQAYRLADELKELVPGLLLLTATPMQLHQFELYSLIELVEPGLFPSFGSYERQREHLPRLNALMRGLKTWDSLSVAEKCELIDASHDLLEGALVAPSVPALDEEGNRERLMDALSAQHPLADVMIRNRKSEVGGFVGREASSVLVQLTDEELELYNDITDYCRYQYDLAVAAKNHAVGFLMVAYQKMLASSTHAIRVSFERRVAKLRKELADLAGDQPSRPPTVDEDTLDAEELSSVVDDFSSVTLKAGLREAEVATLQSLVERLGKVQDSKAVKLLDALEEVFSAHPDEKILIFTTFKETQAFLRRVLEANGHRVSIFNGSMSIDEKEEAVRTFRTKDRVLISTEAGGEGRNFQFCHIVVNYDLPWNPMKVEQRIGRVDRIGQKRTVQIWNLACEDTIEERILNVLQHRIGLFEQSVGSLDPILGTLEDDIVELVMSKLEHLADDGTVFELDLERKVREAREKERRLADFAMDRASLRRDVVNQLLEERSLATFRELEEFAEGVLDYAGGMVSAHSYGGKVLTFSPQLAQRLRMRNSTVRGCFDPAEALQLEELQFFAFGNDVVERLVSLPVEDGVAVAARCDSSLGEGIWVEAWYEIEVHDTNPTGRFIRHLIDSSLNVTSTRVTEMPAGGERLLETPPVPAWSGAALRASRERYLREYTELRSVAQAGLAARQEAARRRAERIFDYRQQRLLGLIADESAWVERAERGTNEKDKKVLPARRGKVEKRRQDLERLREDFATQVAEIDAQEPSTSGRMLAAGLVVGG